ncbi:MAG: hypothetical protein RLZZ216_2397 [Cyanobacteriota bacterium]
MTFVSLSVQCQNAPTKQQHLNRPNHMDLESMEFTIHSWIIKEWERDLQIGPRRFSGLL